ncbi:hypothetical protein TWF970_011618 [Orbilia oligospora]|uniref:Uncharacterized protein n=1 Tax=Orbilia oligospora TaxID=2813651 RepID=A0A7C8VGD2_ORBOL|nr:hypothetical protein TWF970_011618 [Orbilia oligospora]
MKGLGLRLHLNVAFRSPRNISKSHIPLVISLSATRALLNGRFFCFCFNPYFKTRVQIFLGNALKTVKKIFSLFGLKIFFQNVELCLESLHTLVSNTSVRQPRPSTRIRYEIPVTVPDAATRMDCLRRAYACCLASASLPSKDSFSCLRY